MAKYLIFTLLVSTSAQFFGRITSSFKGEEIAWYEGIDDLQCVRLCRKECGCMGILAEQGNCTLYQNFTTFSSSGTDARNKPVYMSVMIVDLLYSFDER